MSALSSDHITMKDSPTYLPILRSVLKSQIQYLVEQLSDAGEETLLLSANVSDGLVDQLGSESGKLFADVYDDFKSEFLGFCQRRKGKRKFESPQKNPVDAKRGKSVPAVLGTTKSVKSPQNVPKVSSARIIVSQKPTSTQAKLVAALSSPGTQLIQPDIGELGGPEEEEYSEIEDTGLGYEEIEEVDSWRQEEIEDGAETPSSSQDPSSSSQDQSLGSKVRTAVISKRTVTSQMKIPVAKVDVKEQNTPINLEKMFSKAVSCSECGKLFIRGDALELHMLSHTGEYPFTCQVCGLGYRKKRSYVIHMTKKHPEVQVDDI